MADVHRLVLALVLALIALGSSAAIAPKMRYQATWGAYSTGLFTSEEGACLAWQAISPYAVSTARRMLFGDGRCSLVEGANNEVLIPVDVRPKAECPANSTGESVCVCLPEFVEKDGQCVPKNQCEAGEAPDMEGNCKPKCPSELLIRNKFGFCQIKDSKPGSNSEQDKDCSWRADQVDVTQEISIPALTLPPAEKRCDITAGTTADTIAGKGCQGTFDADFAYTGYDGKTYARGRFVFNGQGCSTKDENPANNTPPTKQPKCPKGQPGTVNGVEVCIPFGDKGTVGKDPNSKTDEETDKDGNKKTTTTNVSTKCENGVCTTTTTTTVNNNGNSTTTTNNINESQEAYCKKNPSSRNCGGSGSSGSGNGNGNGNGDDKDSEWGGSCGAFTCSGDAIQCAISREIHTQNCLLNKETPEAEAARVALAKPAGDLTGNLPGNKEVEIGSGSFDTSDALGGARCVQDVSINVGPFATTLPISKVCPLLPMLGYVLMGLSFLVAARIVAGA